MKTITTIIPSTDSDFFFDSIVEEEIDLRKSKEKKLFSWILSPTSIVVVLLVLTLLIIIILLFFVRCRKKKHFKAIPVPVYV